MKSKDRWNLHLGNTTCIYCGVLPDSYHTPDCPSHSPYGPKESKDSISPDHYKFGEGLEAIDIIKASVPDFSSYCEGNVLKYMLRFRKKGGAEDLMKAKKYLEWMIETEAHE